MRSKVLNFANTHFTFMYDQIVQQQQMKGIKLQYSNNIIVEVIM